MGGGIYTVWVCVDTCAWELWKLIWIPKIWHVDHIYTYRQGRNVYNFLWNFLYIKIIIIFSIPLIFQCFFWSKLFLNKQAKKPENLHISIILNVCFKFYYMQRK